MDYAQVLSVLSSLPLPVSVNQPLLRYSVPCIQLLVIVPTKHTAHRPFPVDHEQISSQPMEFPNEPSNPSTATYVNSLPPPSQHRALCLSANSQSTFKRCALANICNGRVTRRIETGKNQIVNSSPQFYKHASLPRRINPETGKYN